MIRRPMQDGHDSVAFDVNPNVVSQLESEGAIGAGPLAGLVEKLEQPRVIRS